MSTFTTSSAERVLVLWVPDWPIHAYEHDQREATDESAGTATAGSASPDAAPSGSTHASAALPLQPAAPPAPIALVAQRRVIACSRAARREGVRIGQREREAQAVCPTLLLHPHDPEVDERRFAPILAALEQVIPGVESRRPGLCAMRARGPARYYGGEEPAARAVLALAAELGLPEVRVGIADGLFAAEQATRAGSTDIGVRAPHESLRIVPPGESAAFLSPLPVSRAAETGLAETLHGLGIRTLGALAALPEDAVRQRFGAAGSTAYRRAVGRGAAHGAEVRPRAPVRELAAELSFETPIDSAEQLSFACSALAEQFVLGLTEERLVCTALRVELTDDTGIRHEREWFHPQRFTAGDLVGRIRWQTASLVRHTERGGAGIARVRVTPTHTDRAAAHEPGLWSNEPDERVHHHLSRAQSRLGHTGVGTVQLAGGRLLADRQRFVPWSTGRRGVRGHRDSAAGPWPGSLIGPAPSRVFPAPLPAELVDEAGADIGVDADELLSARPARLAVSGGGTNGGGAGAETRTATMPHTEVSDWSSPWPLRERWWQGAPARFRLQLQLTNGDAWLLFRESGRWYAEGRYD